MDLRRALETLLHHDDEARKAEDALLASRDRGGLVALLAGEASELAGQDDARSEGRLARLAGILGRIPTREAVDALLALLDGPSEAGREAAGEALVGLGEERIGLVRDGIRAFVRRGEAAGPGLWEIAYVVTAIDHPEATDLLLELLAAEAAEVVAGALEVAGEHGLDRRVRAAVEGLRGDPRPVTLEDEEGEAVVTIGELAGDVLEALDALAGEGSA